MEAIKKGTVISYKLHLFCTLILLSFKGSEQGPDEERLIDDIFDKSKRAYNHLARPVAQSTDNLEVKFGVALQQIIAVDEKNEMIHTNMWLNYAWFDYKLSWDPAEYGNITSIRLPAKKIWTPDILMYNSADEDIDSKYPTNIVVYSTGELNWVPIGLFISSCSINIKWFPFDEQECTMKFGSWTYDGFNINLTKKWDAVDISNYQESGEWALIGHPAKRNVDFYTCCPEPYIDITFTLHIRRKTLYYGFNLIIPCFMISSLAILVFILPPDSGEKVSLGVTILLALSVFMMIVAEMVPATSSSVPILAVYFACIMVMCALSVCLTVLVLNFHHRNPDMYEMPGWIRTIFCEWGAWLVRMRRPGKDITRRSLMRKSDMRDLEKQLQPSKSLITNIRDDDDYYPYPPPFPHNGMPHLRSMPSMDENLNASKTELKMILRELRYVTNKLKEDNEASDEINDWKFAAMVIDRICLYVFLTYTAVSTLVLFFIVPNMFTPEAGKQT